MTNDSYLFRTSGELIESESYLVAGNIYKQGERQRRPLCQGLHSCVTSISLPIRSGSAKSQPITCMNGVLGKR